MNMKIFQTGTELTWNAAKTWALGTFLPIIIKLLSCILVFIIGKYVIKWAISIIKKAFSKSRIEPSVASFVSSIVRFVLYALLIVAFLEILGIGTASVVTLIGSVGLTIGLALQGSLSNFAGGVLILVLRPFKIGDYILACGVEGTVIAIDIFYTKLRTTDNRIIDIPNGSLMNTVVTNVSTDNKRRFDISVTVSAKTDIEKARSIINEAVEKSGFALPGEKITVAISKYSAASTVLSVRFIVDPDRYWDAQSLIPGELKSALDAGSIESSI